MITLKTNFGDISIELFEKESPITTANFLEYVRSGFYKDTIFHRVIPGFMIQGGGFDTDFVQKPTNKPIKNEAANQLSNKRGTIAMARTQVVDSATCQFFINLVDNGSLISKLQFRSTTATAFSARSFPVWKLWTKSPPSPPAAAVCTVMFRSKTWSSSMLLRNNSLRRTKNAALSRRFGNFVCRIFHLRQTG